jgi:endonuclease/exonuclease/phosphatase family metal-dependent hydrolase
MTAIVTWNIQAGQGCDGVTDLERIAAATRALGEADVVCFQEVSRNDPAIASGEDQSTALASLFPGYRAFFGAGLDRISSAEERREFGNLLLSRLPVLQVFRHLLPRPADGGLKHMQRVAIEAVVQAAGGPLRVVTTHLEYYSAKQRRAQIERLRFLQGEISDNAKLPPVVGTTPYDPLPRPAALVLCGDFNLLPDDAEYRLLFSEKEIHLVDGWRKAHPGKPHPPTTGLYDRKQWKKGGHCRDYFALTPELAAKIVSLEMDDKSDASDHQALRLVLRD